tara:strand:+ start:149 stop:373 length:225 start_codon:yes stop_codon:yes gene_type:complete
MPGLLIRARVAELADAQDLGSCALRRVGSSPTLRTIIFKGEEIMKKFFDNDDIRFFRIVGFTAVVVFSIVGFAF